MEVGSTVTVSFLTYGHPNKVASPRLGDNAVSQLRSRRGLEERNHMDTTLKKCSKLFESSKPEIQWTV